MARILLILSILFFCLCCNQIQPKEVYVDVPMLLPVKNYTTEIFTDSFFHETHFGYAEFMKIDSAGKLVYQYPGPLNNNFRDTTKYIHTAEIILYVDSTKHYFRNCIAKKKGDSLFLSFTDNPFSRSRYELTVIQHKSSVQFKYNQTLAITDSSYKAPVYTITDSGLLLNKKKYQKGDQLKGKMHLVVTGHHSWNKVYTDTVSIFGLFKTVVE